MGYFKHDSDRRALTLKISLKYFHIKLNSKKISKESRNMKFLDAVGPIAISLLVWSQYC